MRDSSPDPLDNWNSDAVNQCDALIGNALAQLAEEETAFSLQEALEYAYSSSTSEPEQWRDIRGREDKEQWYAVGRCGLAPLEGLFLLFFCFFSILSYEGFEHAALW